MGVLTWCVVVGLVHLATPTWGRIVPGGSTYAQHQGPQITQAEATRVEGAGRPDPWRSAEDQSYEVVDDKRKDPDWTPDEDYYYDDEYDYDDQYNYDDDEYDDDEYDDDEYDDDTPYDEDQDNYLNELWSSQEDPDWKPSPEEYNELVEEVASLMTAFLTKEQQESRSNQSITQADIEETIKHLNFNASTLVNMYFNLLHSHDATMKKGDLGQEVNSKKHLSKGVTTNEVYWSPPSPEHTNLVRRKRFQPHIPTLGQNQNPNVGVGKEVKPAVGTLGVRGWNLGRFFSNEDITDEIYSNEVFSPHLPLPPTQYAKPQQSSQGQVGTSQPGHYWTLGQNQNPNVGVGKEVKPAVGTPGSRGWNLGRYFSDEFFSNEDMTDEIYSNEGFSREFFSDEHVTAHGAYLPPPQQGFAVKSHYINPQRIRKRSVPLQQVRQSQVGASQLGQEEDRINHYGTLGHIHETNQYPNQYQNQYQDQTNQNQQWGVWEGVEPLITEYPPRDVGTGVEPAGNSHGGQHDEHRTSFLPWIIRKWNQFTDNVGDKAEEKWNKVKGAARNVVDAVHGAGHAVVSVVRDLGKAVPNIKHHLVTAFSKFGTLVQEGARYCIGRLTHVFDQVKGSEILDKLEQKLSEGNAQVARFFQLIGEKMDHWRATHLAPNVDEGLEVVNEGETNQQQQHHHHHHHHREGEQDQMPDFFQDDDVALQLRKLVEIGVLTQDEYEFLSTQQQQQQQQQQHTPQRYSQGRQ